MSRKWAIALSCPFASLQCHGLMEETCNGTRPGYVSLPKRQNITEYRSLFPVPTQIKHTKNTSMTQRGHSGDTILRECNRLPMFFAQSG
jgi:hypothetical protein